MQIDILLGPKAINKYENKLYIDGYNILKEYWFKYNEFCKKIILGNSGNTKIRLLNDKLDVKLNINNKIIKFEGCYHGHHDSFLIRAGSGGPSAARRPWRRRSPGRRPRA